MRTDPRTMRKLQAALETMPLGVLRDFCDASMKALLVAETVFERRFPAEWRAWDKWLESGAAVEDVAGDPRRPFKES